MWNPFFFVLNLSKCLWTSYLQSFTSSFRISMYLFFNSCGTYFSSFWIFPNVCEHFIFKISQVVLSFNVSFLQFVWNLFSFILNLSKCMWTCYLQNFTSGFSYFNVSFLQFMWNQLFFILNLSKCLWTFYLQNFMSSFHLSMSRFFNSCGTDSPSFSIFTNACKLSKMMDWAKSNSSSSCFNVWVKSSFNNTCKSSLPNVFCWPVFSLSFTSKSQVIKV